MKNIFVSYKRDDLNKVNVLINEIKKRTSVDCWIDLEGIESGDEVSDRIINAINEADIILFMMSKLSIKSDYVLKEIRYAINKAKKIVAVSIDGTSVKDCDLLCFELGDTDYINPTNSLQWNKLMNNIVKWTSHSNALSQPIENVQVKNPALQKNNNISIEFNASGVRVAYIENECIKLLTFSNGEHILPATLAFKDGIWSFGESNLIKSEPSIKVFDIANLIFSNADMVHQLAHFYNIQLEETITGEFKLDLSGQLYSITDITIKYFKLLKTEIERQTGYTFDMSSFVCSSVLNLSQIYTLKNICNKAGFKIRYNQSTSMIAMHIMHKDQDEENNILVIDICQHFFVVSSLNVGDGVYEVRSIIGDNVVSYKQVKDAIDWSMKETYLNYNDVNRVILLNNSNQNFLPIQFQSIFPNATCLSCSPEAAVKGACLEAGVLTGLVKDVILLDVVPHSIEIAAYGGSFHDIINANTTIPTLNRSVKLKRVNDQSGLLIKLYSSFPSIDGKNNRKMFAQYTAYGIISDQTNEYKLSLDIDANVKFHVSLTNANGTNIPLTEVNYSENYMQDIPMLLD